MIAYYFQNPVEDIACFFSFYLIFLNKFKRLC